MQTMVEVDIVQAPLNFLHKQQYIYMPVALAPMLLKEALRYMLVVGMAAAMEELLVGHFWELMVLAEAELLIFVLTLLLYMLVLLLQVVEAELLGIVTLIHLLQEELEEELQVSLLAQEVQKTLHIIPQFSLALLQVVAQEDRFLLLHMELPVMLEVLEMVALVQAILILYYILAPVVEAAGTEEDLVMQQQVVARVMLQEALVMFILHQQLLAIQKVAY